jgi:hypothetical protein
MWITHVIPDTTLYFEEKRLKYFLQISFRAEVQIVVIVRGNTELLPACAFKDGACTWQTNLGSNQQ